MSILHLKSNTIADFTGTVTVYNSAGSTETLAATNLVRPSDWNSEHKVNYALGGNTAGSASVSGNDIALYGGNNITLSADTANSRLHISGPNVSQYLTTARGSTDAIGLATALTGNGVAWTVNSAGISLDVPAFITTYVNDLTSGRAGTGTTFAGTNVSGSMTMGTNGLQLALSVAAPGGGGVTLPGYELFPPIGGGVAFSTGGLGTLYLQKFNAPANISFNNIERRASGSTVSSAVSAQAAHSISYGLYSLGTGGSSTVYNLIASSSLFMQASYSSNLSAGYTISGGGTSFTSSSAGTGLMSGLTGFKHIYFPFTSTITAGGAYGVAFIMSSATTGVTGPLRLGMQELSVFNNLTLGKFYNSTVLATNKSFVGDWAQAAYSSSSNGLPATLALSGLTNAVSQQRMYLQFDA